MTHLVEKHKLYDNDNTKCGCDWRAKEQPLATWGGGMQNDILLKKANHTLTV